MMTRESSTAGSVHRTFSDFIRGCQDAILEDWARTLRSLPHAREFGQPALTDHVPRLLAWVAEFADPGDRELPKEAAPIQAVTGLGGGFDLEQVVHELTLLRACILERWERERGVHAQHVEVIALHRAIDQAITACIAAFLQTIGVAVARPPGADTLALSARRFQGILDHVPAAVYLKDLQGRYTVVSRRFDELFGIDGKSIIGKRDNEILPGDAARVLRANDRKVLDTGEALETEEHFSLRGRQRTVLSVKFPLLDEASQPYALCGISTDISERLRVQAALRESEERLRLATEVTNLGTFDWDLPTGTIRWSDRVREIFGIGDEHPIDWDTRAARIHPDDRERALGLIAAAMDPVSDGAYAAEYRILPANGAAERWVDDRGQVLFGKDGRPRRFIGLVADVTDRKHADLERERLVRELEQAVRFRDDILAIVSHDLRSPLQTIEVSAEVLTRQALSGDAARSQQALQSIRRASRRMAQLIGDLLDMASIRAGRLSVELGTCDARALVDEALEFHAPAAAAKAVELDKQLGIGDVQVRCDRARMQQVFSNLLGNAIKFCDSGVVVQVRVEREGAAVRFTVADNGPGIAPEEMARIFEPYWSGERHADKGTGLGLFITKGIVEAQGGQLWVESIRGMGSSFHFTVPVAGSSPAPLPQR